ncbi:FAD-binding domain-containing protein, partial [Periconia macrospinosa]
PQCEALLASNLSSRVLLPNDPLYEPRVDSYYYGPGRLHPWCFFVPETTTEISTAIKALNAAAATKGTEYGWGIAVRSGGHMHPGSNNIINGVTIDLGNMNASWYNATTNLASLQPGGRWGDVYRNLHDKFNVTVTGGRAGDVGVGGFLLGGGISYHTGRNGFGCNTIINYEVVLANGSIINANKSSHPDLYKALKGGGFNFGIVTRFDVETLPAVDLAFGENLYGPEHIEAIVDALVDFTDTTSEESADHTFTVYQPGTMAFQQLVNTKGNLNTTAFEAFQTVPALDKSWERKSLADAAPVDKSDAGSSGLSYTFTTKNTRPILHHILAQFNNLSTTLSTKGKYTPILVLQPLPTYYGHLSQRNGGTVLGLDTLDSNAILHVIVVDAPEGGSDAIAVADAEIKRLMRDVQRFVEGEDGVVEWVYMNYADGSQNPLGSYGEGNLAFLERVAEVYDPEGWWQRMVPGGFRVAKARG